MKIAFLNIYQGAVDRGAETFVSELSKRLKKNHTVDVLSGFASPRPHWPILWRAFLDPNGLSIAQFSLKKLSQIWREKYDIVVPLNGGWQPALVRLLTWIYRGKMIISGQSGMGWDDINNLYCFPDVFVALSTSAKRWARRINPFVRVEYVPNGVDMKRFTPEGEKYRVRLSAPIVLCVGALTEAKRIDLAIRAVNKLKDVSLLVVGDGELKRMIQELGKDLLGNRFQLIKLSPKEMPSVYRTANAFTLPSESYQSFEIALVEAMAINLPVVANSDPIREEIVGNAGILVDPTNTDEYAEALRQALGKDWGDKPRKQAEKFDWDEITEDYEELFKTLIR